MFLCFSQGSRRKTTWIVVFVFFVVLWCINIISKWEHTIYLAWNNEILHVSDWYNERRFECHWLLKGWIATSRHIILLVEGGIEIEQLHREGDRNRKKSFFFYTSVIRKAHNPDWNGVKSRMSLFEGVVKVRENSVLLLFYCSTFGIHYCYHLRYHSTQ